MKKIFYLSSCSTCRSILKNGNFDAFEKQDIKEEALTVAQVQMMKEFAGSYEALFSRRAKLYREKGLHEIDLTEKDYKYYLTEHYTFLKRPVIIDGDNIYIGSSPKVKKELALKYGS